MTSSRRLPKFNRFLDFSQPADISKDRCNSSANFSQSSPCLNCAAPIVEKGRLPCFADDGGLQLRLSNLHDSPPPVYRPTFILDSFRRRSDRSAEIYEHVKGAGVEIKFELQEARPNLAFVWLAPDYVRLEVRGPRDRV